MQNAFQGELETLLLDRMETLGGMARGIARIRSVFSTAMSAYDNIMHLVDMAVAGYEAMTTPRRMCMRVAAAHSFGYWVFQERGLRAPINPPNAFLIAERAQDARDADVGAAIGNSNYSTDGGLTSADWNNIWRTGARDALNHFEGRMRRMTRNGEAQRTLMGAFGPAADLHRQSHDAIAGQYRTIFIAPKFGAPATAARSFFVSSLHGVNQVEQRSNISIYEQYPYAPR